MTISNSAPFVEHQKKRQNRKIVVSLGRQTKEEEEEKKRKLDMRSENKKTTDSQTLHANLIYIYIAVVENAEAPFTL